MTAEAESVAMTLQHQSSISSGEKVLHGMLLALGLGVFVMSMVMKSEGATEVYLPGMDWPMPELCSSRVLFGIDCPGCGMTRAFICITHGDLARAWHFNPASFLVYLLIVGQIPWQSYQLARIYRGRAPVLSLWAYAVPAAAIVAVLVQWIVRTVIPW